MSGNVHPFIEGKMEGDRLFLGCVPGKGVSAQREIYDPDENIRANEKLLLPSFSEAEGGTDLRAVQELPATRISAPRRSIGTYLQDGQAGTRGPLKRIGRNAE